MDTTKYQSIKITGCNGKWSAIDEYTIDDVDYILFASDNLGIRTPNIICQLTAAGELIMLGKTRETTLSAALEKISERSL